VADGASKTVLFGEKYLNPLKYETGDDGADNNSVYQGNDWDTNRWFGGTPDMFPPRRDTPGYDTMSSRFGSAHTSGFFAVFCDGSVHPIQYDVDQPVYMALGTRDGNEVESYID
jgi:hypothetical protein